MSVTRHWAEQLSALPFEALPADAVDQGKRVLLDFLGVALAGAQVPISRMVGEYCTALGGRPEATAILQPARLPALHAALVNGVLGHALDMDDGHRAAAGHPGVATIPAALAAAERAGASGRDLLRAIVCGYEVFVRLAAAINPAHLRRGFHTTATVGPFAAATAAALLLRLDVERFVGALGLAGVQGAGLMEVFHDGAMAKPFQVGRASAAGLLAADLALRGGAGPAAIIEGAQGFMAALAGTREAASLVEGLGEEWAIRGVYFKEHAACRHTHAAIDAAAQLVQEHGLRSWEVREVVVRTYEVAHRLCGAAELPAGPAEAKFSLPFTVALGLRIGHARQSCFTPELVADPELRAVAGRVRVVVDPALDARYPRQRPAALDVTTLDGRRLQAEVPLARGEPERPLTRADLEAKFLDNARRALADASARSLIDHVWALDSLPTVGPVVELLTATHRAL